MDAVRQPGDGSAPGGYHGRYLSIDLERRRGVARPLPEDVLRRFLGGSGLGSWLLCQTGDPTVDPLAPAAPLVFALSPLVGSPLTTSAKFAIVAKSPLTHRINDSLIGSGFALEAKKCGCDALVIRGRAAEPSILLIDDGQVRLYPADDLWGRTCQAAEQALRQRWGAEYQVAVIGPAGERLVSYATISHAGRHAGRGGHGAVMGSKNLKAVLVRGTQHCRWASPGALAELARTLSERARGPATAKYRELGTATNLLVFNRLHALPTRNFQAGRFDAAERLAPESLRGERPHLRASCAACTIGCEHRYQLPDGGPNAGAHVRVEYESLVSLGALCGVADHDSVLQACRQCDEWGLDTISAGGTIAFAMECAARGWLDAPWLRFGSGAALLTALERIVHRDGLGDALARGSRDLARALGAKALAIAPHVKGLELPGYDPRAMQTLALGLAVGTRGADHNRSGAAEVDFSPHVDRRALTVDAARRAVESEDRAALLDSLILCRFLRHALGDLHAEGAQMLRLVTGWDVSPDELRVTARRIITLKKLYNVRAGWTPDEDQLPDRFFDQPLPDDPRARLSRDAFAAAVRAYHAARGWTETGQVTPELCRELGLRDGCRAHASSRRVHGR